MAYIYKNLVIYERGCSNIEIVDYLKHFCMFEDIKPFEYSSPHDKIVLFLNKNIFKHNKFVNVYKFFELQDKLKDKLLEGYVKIYCDRFNIKVYDFKFNSIDLFKKNMCSFKEYILQTIKIFKNSSKISNIDDYKFTIFWNRDLLSKKQETILTDVKLLKSSTLFNIINYYIFSELDITNDDYSIEDKNHIQDENKVINLENIKNIDNIDNIENIENIDFYYSFNNFRYSKKFIN
jgi:hypothetical protein